MIKVTTTKATHRGIQIAVFSEKTDRGTMYCCSNDCSRAKVNEKWFTTQGEAIANERYEIDSVLH